MPTCHPLTISPVLNIIFLHYVAVYPTTLNMRTHVVPPPPPYSVLDIGVGNGKYGMLIREYLDGCWFDRRYEDPETWRVRLVGVEPFQRYITGVHTYHYDKIIIADILDVVRKGKDSELNGEIFDVILISDMIEHVTMEEGKELLHELNNYLAPGGIIVVSTPNSFFAQKEVDYNIYETHKCQWHEKDFNELKDYNVWATVNAGTLIVKLS